VPSVSCIANSYVFVTQYALTAFLKVIEGIGSYLVIAVGPKGFNGHVMMGASFVILIILVGSLNDWHKEKQFKVNEKREGCIVKVIHVGEKQMIDIHSIVVGDVVLFELGKIIPCDSIFHSGHNVRCDKSGAMGKLYLHTWSSLSGQKVSNRHSIMGVRQAFS